MLLRLSQFFPVCLPLLSTHLPSSNAPPPAPVHVHGSCIYVLWLLHFLYYSRHPPILYLSIMFLAPSSFSPFSPSSLPVDNPPSELHMYDSVPVLVVCLICFCFLDSIVDSCEFVVILTFIVLIFFFLNKSL